MIRYTKCPKRGNDVRRRQGQRFRKNVPSGVEPQCVTVPSVWSYSSPAAQIIIKDLLPKVPLLLPRSFSLTAPVPSHHLYRTIAHHMELRMSLIAKIKCIDLPLEEIVFTTLLTPIIPPHTYNRNYLHLENVGQMCALSHRYEQPKPLMKSLLKKLIWI